MLDLRRLRLLVELADRGTISATAEALHYTPSTVSSALSTLERDLGVALLIRTARSVRLTPAAEALVRNGREILRLAEAAQVQAQSAPRQDRTVTVATFPSAAAGLVAGAVAELRETQVQVVTDEPVEALTALRSGTVDVAVIYAFDDPAEADLNFTFLCEDPMWVLAPPGSSGDLGALSDLSFASGPPGTGCRAFTIAACAAFGFTPRLAYETDDVAFVAALADAGLAAAILPRMLLEAWGLPTAVRAPDPALPPRRVYAARRDQRAEHGQADAVVRALVSAARVRERELARPAAA